MEERNRRHRSLSGQHTAGEGRVAGLFTRRLIKEWLVSALVARARGSLLAREGERHDRLRGAAAVPFTAVLTDGHHRKAAVF